MSTICFQAIVFCRKLNWDHLASVLESYSKRLDTGVMPELVPLVRLGAEVRGAHYAQPSTEYTAHTRCQGFVQERFCNAVSAVR